MGEVRRSLTDVVATGGRVDLARVRKTSEIDIERHRAEDGEIEDATPAIGPLRRQLGMTQAQFASALGIPVATLRNWEQGRVTPDPAGRALLRIISRDPEAAFKALAD